MPNLLVEIGTEELPLAGLDVIYAELAKKAQEVLQENRLTFGKIRVEATPRRIALFVESIALRQEDRVLEMPGPSYEKAYDSEGKPTPVLQGFLKSKQANLNEVQIKETPKGRFVTVSRHEKGKTAASILPLLLGIIFTSLSFPKTMRWEKTGFRFARPIRWIVALLDKQLIPLQLADVKSARTSYGHRFLAPKPFALAKADWKLYQALLKRARVILSLEEREKTIRKTLQSKFHQKSFDEDLVHTAAQLVEEPFFIQGGFSKTYLDLPAEVLASCMKKNQKIFACYDAKGHLMNKFVGVMNGGRKGLAKIRQDYENVLESRLRDSRYFYDIDTKHRLEEKFPLLEQIVYLGKLGTMRQKAERLESLGEVFASLIGRDDLKADLKRAARLSKIDLMTQLVYEFPDLQGIVGREYALEAGEKEDVAKAIGTQYFPQNLVEDYRELPRKMAPLGAMLGIIDRLDHLAGTFGTGLEPTGSQDPFALRRAGGVGVKLIRAFGFHFSLTELFEASIRLYGSSLTVSKTDLIGRLRAFLQERIVFELRVSPGSRPYEILQAVFRSSFDDLADVFNRFEILSHLYEEDPKTFIKAAKVVERTANILKGVQGEVGEVKTELFKESLERKLYDLLEEKSGEISQALERRDYGKATLRFGQIFYDPLHDFFEQVMVNVEDTEIRRNRQALMKRLYSLYAERLADLSVLSRMDQG